MSLRPLLRRCAPLFLICGGFSACDGEGAERANADVGPARMSDATAQAIPDAMRDAIADSAPDVARDAEVVKPPDASPLPCERLFGSPNERTGLTEAQCAPTCACGGLDFTPPTYGADAVAALRRLRLDEPFSDLEHDPYTEPAPAPPVEGQVCGVLSSGEAMGGYTVQSFVSLGALENAGALLTHHGACGLCSPLADLAVYMAYPDLTQPVRACGVRGLSEGEAVNFQCLLELGFTSPCARIWLYNTQNTRRSCLADCLRALDAPYHLPDGTLNPCLLCDEVKSGPVFKSVAGRTRRNSGLPNAMCRPCAEANPVTHDYSGL